MDLSHGNTKEVFFDNQDGYVFFLVTLCVLFNQPETSTTINNKKNVEVIYIFTKRRRN